jgi:uncharacterized protein (TIGR02118 family)
MFQLIVLFKQPPDPAAFDRAYREEHVPLARRIPGLFSLSASRLLPQKTGVAPYYQISVLTFADREAYKAAMKSAENAEAGASLDGFAAGLAEFYTAETVATT